MFTTNTEGKQMLKPVDIVIAGCLAAAAGCGYAVYKLAYQPHYFADARVIEWRNEAGKPVSVTVTNEPCPTGPTRACAVTDGPFTQHALIFLGGQDRAIDHELAHVSGMRHGEWFRNGFTFCATVTNAGLNTKYRAGDLICVGKDGSDYIERRTTVAEVK